MVSNLQKVKMVGSAESEEYKLLAVEQDFEVGDAQFCSNNFHHNNIVSHKDI